MMQREFYIKEVADIIGVTRDTLRIYEQEGLITPGRDDNDFRIYTKEDIYRLIAIKFHRANDLSLKDIREILKHADSRDILEVLQQQINEEESLIALHRSNLRRLNMAKYYYRARPEELCIEEGTMDAAYVVSEEYTDFFDTVKAFFSLAKKDPDYVMSLLNLEYDIQASLDSYRSSYVLLDEREINALNRMDIKESCKRLPGAECLRYMVYWREPVPDRSHIETIVDYAREHGIELSGRVYAHFLYQFETENGPEFLIEILAEKA